MHLRCFFCFCNLYTHLRFLILEIVEETTNSMDQDSLSNGIREISPVQGPTLPILQKIICLSSKIEVKS